MLCVGRANQRMERNTRRSKTYLIPQVDKDGGGAQFSWQDDDPVVPVVPAHGERECGVDEAFSQFDVSTSDREIGNHLAERDLHKKSEQEIEK